MKSIEIIFTCVFTFLFLFSFASAQSATTTSTSSATTSLCFSLNSLNIYSYTNLSRIQEYFQKTYYPKIQITGINDPQTKSFVKQFQYDFGLKETGTLGDDTLSLLRKNNGCYKIDTKVTDLESTYGIKRISRDELLKQLLEFIRSTFSASTTVKY